MHSSSNKNLSNSHKIISHKNMVFIFFYNREYNEKYFKSYLEYEIFQYFKS